MKKIIISLLLLVALVSLFACKKDGTSKSSGRKTIVFNFESNPTTGYMWYYDFASGGDYAELEITKDEFKAADTNLVGAPGVHEFKFIAKKPGPQTITFTYKRPWVGGDTAYDVAYDINVDKDLNIECLNKKKGKVNSDKDLTFFPTPTFE